MTAVSPTSAWAVGEYSDSVFVNPDKPLIMHWNGKAWSRVANPAPQDTFLWTMAPLSDTSSWVVGAHTKGASLPGGANASAVILHWNG